MPSALAVLSAVPVLAGIARISNLVGGAPATTDDARFFASPAPVMLHIVVVSIYCVLGALQFAPAFRRKHPGWHRAAGCILVPCGLATALTGLWMTQFYSRIATDSALLHGMRLAVGAAMVVAVVLAVVALRRRDFRTHGAWMIRAYALGQGAGTQVLTHLPWFLFVGTPGPVTRAMLMGAGWLINIAFAEWLIRKRE